MTTYCALVRGLIAAWALTACKTTTSADVKYANAATSIEDIQANACKNYIKSGSCILRLYKYKADDAKLAALNDGVMAKYHGDRLDQSALQANSGLSKTEFAALVIYAGGQYSEMNGALRGRQEHWQGYEPSIYAAGSALTKLAATLLFSGVAYRTETSSLGKLSKFKETYTPGNVVLETGFLSTTKLKDFGFTAPLPDEVLLRYKVKSRSGTYIGDLVENPREQEVLFTPGSVFRVTSLQQVKTPSRLVNGELNPAVQAEALDIELEEILVDLQ